jgi:dual specificity tyrosine-phosphorylation-regulated kinase 2/3/4
VIRYVAFIKSHFESLSLLERREILDYQSIWYSGQKGKKNQATPESTANNHGYDDERGDYIHIQGDHLAYRYEIMCLLGKGSFGQVLQCRDHKTGQCVAIKIIRNKKRFHSQALVEVKILENLVKWVSILILRSPHYTRLTWITLQDPEDKHNLIKINQHFYFRGHLCIVTELLSINLYEMVKANSFVGFSTTLIRRFTVQLLSSLQVMRNNRVIHCDLKPEVR